MSLEHTRNRLLHLPPADREANSLRERCHLEFDLRRLGCHSDEHHDHERRPPCLPRRASRPSDRAGRDSRARGMQVRPARRAVQLISLLAQQCRELWEEVTDARVGLRSVVAADSSAQRRVPVTVAGTDHVRLRVSSSMLIPADPNGAMKARLGQCPLAWRASSFTPWGSGTRGNGLG